MAKKPEDIKKQKEKELEKKRKALQKRQKERAKYDSAYAEKIKDSLEKEKSIKIQKKDSVIEKLTKPAFCIPILSIFCFGVLCIISYLNGYKIFSPEFKVTGLFHCLYVGDLSIGVSSRLLIGSVLSLFYDTLTSDNIDSFARTFVIISFVLQSVFTAFVIRKGIREKNIFILLLSLIFIVNPVTVCAYELFFGVLDLYNYVIFIIAMIIAIKGKSSVQFLIPILSIIGLFIHYSYFLAFFPPIFVISLYRTVNAEDKKLKKEATALGINTAVSVGVFFYLSLIAKNFLIMNADEMLRYVHSKVDKSVLIFDDYLMYYIYDIFKGTQMESASSSLSALININNDLRKTGATTQYLLFISLLVIIFWVICAILVKNTKSFKQKLPFIAACIMPLALIPELVLSSDTWRWISSTTFCLFYILFAFYLMDIPALTDIFEKLKKSKLALRISITAVLLVYFVFCFIFEHRIYE